MPSYVGEVGTRFTASFKTSVQKRSCCEPVLVDFDLSTATAVAFLFQKPDGTVVEVVADVLVARRGQACYVADDTFLDQDGVWVWQPRVTTPDGTWFAPRSEFVVETPLIAS